MVKIKNRILLFVGLCLMSLCSCLAMAQTLGTEDLNVINSKKVQAFVSYALDQQGFYRENDVSKVTMVNAPYRMYAYDKHDGVLYVVNETGNYAVTLTREQIRLMKRNKDVPHLRGDDLAILTRQVTTQVRKLVKQHNDMRTNELQQLKRRDEEERAKQAEAERFREEQRKLEEARRAAAREAALKEEYRRTHLWNVVPTHGASLTCIMDDCDKVTEADSVYMVNMDGKFLYYITDEPFQIGETIHKVHVSTVPAKMSNGSGFKLHCEVFKDSIMHEEVTDEFVKRMNQLQYEIGVEKVRQKAPHGYFLNWGWESNPNLMFRCNFFNLDSRTVKEMVLYWELLNAHSEPVKTGSLKMTGVQIKPNTWRAAKWSHTSVEVPEEVAQFRLSKVSIRYTNNEVVSLSPADIFSNSDAEVLPGVPVNGEEYEYEETEMSRPRIAAPKAKGAHQSTKVNSKISPRVKKSDSNDLFN